MSRVTVLIPNYNREKLLPVCLESLRAQTFDDWRAVIGDNASTDRSVDVARSFGDPRMEVVCRPENIGYLRNTNLLLADVDTPFVAILHSDDWWESAFLDELVALLDRWPHATFAVPAVNYRVDGRPPVIKTLTEGPESSAQLLSSADATRALVHRWPFVTPSDVLCRTDVYRRVGGFEESLPLSTDWLTWLRAASLGPVAVAARPLANNRIHAASITGEGEPGARWADEWIRLERFAAADWSLDAPYEGAVTDFRSANALRFVMKSYELHERGGRTMALKLARLAQANAPSSAMRAGALLLRIFIRATPPRVAVGLRTLASGLVRRLRRRHTPARPSIRTSRVAEILTVLERIE